MIVSITLIGLLSLLLFLCDWYLYALTLPYGFLSHKIDGNLA